MKTCIILCGLPGLGKTTWRKRFLAHYPDAAIVSSDDEIEDYARANNTTYKQAFDTLAPAIDSIFLAKLLRSAQQPVIIIDRTNLTLRSRKYTRDVLDPMYRYIAIDFGNKLELALQRNELRKESMRDIPEEVLKRMSSIYIPPSTQEGFSLVLPPSDMFLIKLADGDGVLE